MDNKQLYNGPLIANRQWHEIANRYIDPSANNQRAIFWATQHGDMSMIDRLLADQRVDPCVNMKKLLDVATDRPDFAITKKIVNSIKTKIKHMDLWTLHFLYG
jgi:hypothetical protein